ncbi:MULTISPECIES: GNAT family N-acetyltransferase [Roseomonadaceae]|uniref:GNAT family N-acetyltransferase n=1 Tax=Falsiroseomonas oleicola TaxID=2801474 RepID=A0ABS6HFP5_9PROT|nr:GNAT family N-acetyltransferase [Roseomonas oleicola]MBU8546115.1 GNAT family N-acetyltransferase [Roseomonas oleicola]
MLDDYGRRIRDGQVWVLDHAGRFCGVLVLEGLGDDAILLDNVAVAPPEKGKGHGRTLISFAETEARRRCCREIRLYTHVLMTENIALYRKLGFVETGRVTEKGYNRVYMVKALR